MRRRAATPDREEGAGLGVSPLQLLQALLALRQSPAPKILVAIDDGAEELGSAFGIVARRVGFLIVELNPRCATGASQYSLAVGQSREAGGIEAGKGVEGIALDAAALNRSIQKAVIKGGI